MGFKDLAMFNDSLLAKQTWRLLHNTNCKVEFLSTIMLALFHTKFACISAVSNPVFRWDYCKGSEWDSVKKCSRVCKKNRDSQLDLSGDSRLQAVRNCSRARHARSWSVTPAGALQDKIGQLAVQLPRGWKSQLNQAASPSRKPTLFWKTWLFTFHSHPNINAPFTHERKRASRENFEREILEKNKIDSSPIFIKRLFKFLNFLPLHC